MTIYEKLSAHRQEIMQLAARHGAYNLRVFGSVARGDADEASDLDLVVAMAPGRNLFDVGGLVYDLSALLGCAVHVVTEGGLHGPVRERVLDEARPLEELTA